MANTVTVSRARARVVTVIDPKRNRSRTRVLPAGSLTVTPSAAVFCYKTWLLGSDQAVTIAAAEMTGVDTKRPLFGWSTLRIYVTDGFYDIQMPWRDVDAARKVLPSATS